MRELKIKLDEALREIKERNAQRVLVQLPEGLKTKALEIVKELEKSKAEVICLVEPCFGACDLALHEAQVLKADLVIHLGHEKFSGNLGKTVFISLHYAIEKEVFEKLSREFLKKLGENVEEIALGANAQYLNYLDDFRRVAGEEGINVLMEQNKTGVKGQVLGCDVSALKKLEKRAEAVVFIGDGLFHPLAISFAVKKPLLVVNPLEKSVEWFSEKEGEKLVKKRILMIEKAREAKSFGILVSTKEGQLKLQKAMELKELIEKNGKKAFVFAADLLLPDYLLGVGVDCLVSTACPRIALEDFSNWKKPVLNEEEVKILFGMKRVSDYSFEELF